MSQTQSLPLPTQTQSLKAKAFAYIIDVLLWSYLLLVGHKVVYEKVIMGVRAIDSHFTWMQPVYALVAGLAIALIINFTQLSIGRAMMGLYNRDENKPIMKEPYSLLGVFIVFVTFIAGLHIAQVSMTEFLSPAGLSGAKRIFTALFNPNFAIIEPALFSAVETIYMAFIATVIALPVALLDGLFRS